MEDNRSNQNDHAPGSMTDHELRKVVDYALRADTPVVDGHPIRTKPKELWVSFRAVIKKVGKTAKREKVETIIAARILKKYVTDKESVTEEEWLFLKSQSLDLARILPIVVVQAVPAPIPITPFLITLGSKIGIDLVPKEQVRPEEYDDRIPKTDQRGREGKKIDKEE